MKLVTVINLIVGPFNIINYYNTDGFYLIVGIICTVIGLLDCGAILQKKFNILGE